MVNVLVVLSDLEETAKKLIETAVAIAKPGERDIIALVSLPLCCCVTSLRRSGCDQHSRLRLG